MNTKHSYYSKSNNALIAILSHTRTRFRCLLIVTQYSSPKFRPLYILYIHSTTSKYHLQHCHLPLHHSWTASDVSWHSAGRPLLLAVLKMQNSTVEVLQRELARNDQQIQHHSQNLHEPTRSLWNNTLTSISCINWFVTEVVSAPNSTNCQLYL